MEHLRANAGGLGLGTERPWELESTESAGMSQRVKSLHGNASANKIHPIMQDFSNSDCCTTAPPSLPDLAHAECAPMPPGLADSPGGWLEQDDASSKWSVGSGPASWNPQLDPVFKPSKGEDQQDRMVRFVEDILDEDEETQRSVSYDRPFANKDILKRPLSISASVYPKGDVKTASSSGTPVRITSNPEEYVCKKTWRTTTMDDSNLYLTVIQGQRLLVSWVDAKPHSWVLASYLGDPEQKGYCPHDVLVKSTLQPLPPAVDTSLRVKIPFEAPTFEPGYMTVTLGDVVRVLQPVREPYVWALCECVSRCSPCDYGWVPLSVLDCSMAPARQEKPRAR
eukprot:TRINITY_DN21189_c0_g3_i1.p1 TRINITY_DN21189_c0_g3~~TRINITY_DN21189_c0_g3_i1.p1  ORF type:complete len:339 (+),score=20.96 TRINITY_DN21189_c0_g3_i1:63-1079(+)